MRIALFYLVHFCIFDKQAEEKNMSSESHYSIISSNMLMFYPIKIEN